MFSLVTDSFAGLPRESGFGVEVESLFPPLNKVDLEELCGR